MNGEEAGNLSELASIATIVRGVVSGADSGVLVFMLDDMLAEKIEHAVVAQIINNTGNLIAKLKWEVVGVFFWPDSHTVSCVGSRGRFAAIASNIDIETIAGDLDISGAIGMVRDATRSEEALYCVVLDGRLYRKYAGLSWELIIPPVSDLVLHRLAQGNTPNEGLLAATADGRVVRAEQGAWVTLDMPTSSVVNSIWMCGHDRWVACGLAGLLVIARGDAIEAITHDYEHENFWGICEFDDRVYVASLHHLYLLVENKTLERIDPLGASTYYRLVVGGGVMWSIGGKDVLQLVDGHWSRII